MTETGPTNDDIPFQGMGGGPIHVEPAEDIAAVRDHLMSHPGPDDCGCEEAFDRLVAQVEGLREALERIGWHELSGTEARDVAREALTKTTEED